MLAKIVEDTKSCNYVEAGIGVMQGISTGSVQRSTALVDLLSTKECCAQKYQRRLNILCPTPNVT
eukprot:5214306-Amphidinium_carterae.1